MWSAYCLVSLGESIYFITDSRYRSIGDGSQLSEDMLRNFLVLFSFLYLKSYYRQQAVLFIPQLAR